jgi:hypothetical protein
VGIFLTRVCTAIGVRRLLLPDCPKLALFGIVKLLRKTSTGLALGFFELGFFDSGGMNPKLSAARRHYWRKTDEEQMKGGQSLDAFFRERGVSGASSYTWRKRLIKETPIEFALVEPSPATRVTSRVELVACNGERLHFVRGVDAATRAWRSAFCENA